MARYLILDDVKTWLSTDGVSLGVSYSFNYSDPDNNDSLSGSLGEVSVPLASSETFWEDIKAAAVVKFNTDFGPHMNGSSVLMEEVVISPHDTKNLSDLKIANYAGVDYKDHRTLNYKTALTSRLHKEITTMHRGEVRQVDYYNAPDKSDKVLTVTVDYVRQPNGLLTRVNDSASWGDADFFGRRTVRTWYRTDGSAHPLTKTTDKTYDAVAAMSEGERRRKNVVQDLSVNLLTMLVVTETAANPAAPTDSEILAAEAIGVAYLSKYESAISIYYTAGDLSWTGKAGHQSTGDANDAPTPNITTDVESWLSNDLTLLGMPGVTIKDYLLSTLKLITEA